MEIDPATGVVAIVAYASVNDIGRIVSPVIVQGQIEGGVVMGLGHALMEDYVQVDGQTTTPGFAKYILPTTLDVPMVTSVLIDEPDPKTPLGVKGIGEAAITPPAAPIIWLACAISGWRKVRVPSQERASPQDSKACARGRCQDASFEVSLR